MCMRVYACRLEVNHKCGDSATPLGSSAGVRGVPHHPGFQVRFTDRSPFPAVTG